VRTAEHETEGANPDDLVDEGRSSRQKEEDVDQEDHLSAGNASLSAAPKAVNVKHAPRDFVPLREPRAMRSATSAAFHAACISGAAQSASELLAAGIP
jgi:hypothetical protein